MYRAIQSHKGKNPFNFPNLQGQDYHKYNTRGKLKFRLPSCKTNWGKNRSSYHFINEFNNLSFSINTNTTFSDLSLSFGIVDCNLCDLLFFISILYFPLFKLIYYFEDPHENHRCVTGASSQNIYLIINNQLPRT